MLYIVLSLLSFALTLQRGTLAYNDISLIYRYEQLGRAFEFIWDHRSNLGGPNYLVGNAFYNALVAGLSWITGSVVAGHKIVLVLLAAFSGVGFAILVGYFVSSRISALLAGLYGMFNFWVFHRIELGHNTLLLSYSILPFALFFFFKGIRKRLASRLVLSGVMAGLLFIADPHMAYLFFMMITLYLLVELAFKLRVNLAETLKNSALILLVIGLGLSLTLPFLFPVVTVKEPSNIFRSEEIINYTVHPALVKLSYLPQIVLAALVFALSLKTLRQEKFVVYFMLLAAIGVVLSMGGLWPLSVFYAWLFEHVPGFAMFRETSKFLLFPAVALCFFIGKLADRILRIFVKKFMHILGAYMRFVSFVSFALGLLLFSGLMFNSYGFLVKTVDIPPYQVAYDDWLYSQSDDFRIAYMPPALWATQYTWADHNFLDPAVAEQVKPTVEIRSELDATLSASFTKWVYTSIYQGKTDEIGALLGLMGVKYLVVREDATIPQYRDDLKAFNKNQRNVTTEGKGLKAEKRFGPITVYRVEQALPMMFPIDNFFLAYGDRRLLITLADEGWDFESSIIVFADNLGMQSRDILKRSSGIIIEGDRYWDLLISWLGGKYVTETWGFGTVSTNGLKNWVIGDLTWHWFDGTLNVYPGKYTMTYGINEATIPIRVESSGRYLVLVQTYVASPSTFKGLAVSVSGHDYVEIKSPNNVVEGRYVWIPIGYYNLSPENGLVKLRSLGGVAAVSKIATLPEEEVEPAEQELLSFLESSDKNLIYVIDDHAWTFKSDPIKSIRKVVGAGNGILVDLSDFKLQADLYIFRHGYYEITLRTFGSGNLSSICASVDGKQSVTLHTSEQGFSSVTSGSLNLEQGRHTISLSGGGLVDFMMILPSNLDLPLMKNNNGICRESFAYQADSGSLYRITLNGKGLVFLETYSANWLLEGNGQTHTPLPGYSFANVFLAEKEVSAHYVLMYIGVKAVKTGLLLSVATAPFLGLAILNLSSSSRGAKTGKTKPEDGE